MAISNFLKRGLKSAADSGAFGMAGSAISGAAGGGGVKGGIKGALDSGAFGMAGKFASGMMGDAKKKKKSKGGIAAEILSKGLGGAGAAMKQKTIAKEIEARKKKKMTSANAEMTAMKGDGKGKVLKKAGRPGGKKFTSDQARGKRLKNAPAKLRKKYEDLERGRGSAEAPDKPRRRRGYTSTGTYTPPMRGRSY